MVTTQHGVLDGCWLFAREFCVITRVLLGFYYSVLGGCQGIVRWLLGCCCVVARVLQMYSGCLPGHCLRAI